MIRDRSAGGGACDRSGTWRAQSLLKKLDDDALPDSDRLVIDFAFHHQLIDIAGNPLMQSARTTPTQSDHPWSRRLHKAMMRALNAHDPDAANDAAMQ